MPPNGTQALWQGLQKVACRSRTRVVFGKRLRPEEAHGLPKTTGVGQGNYLRKARLPARKTGVR